MFFKIAPQNIDQFMFNYRLNDTYWLNCDAGWTDITTKYGTAYIKGYCHERAFDIEFAEELFEDAEPRFTGNFLAVLARSSGTIDITNDRTRSTPLWRNESELGNIDIKGTNVWATNTVTITDKMTENTWDTITPNDLTHKTFDDALSHIDRILVEKFTTLKTNLKNVKVFYTGGIDTLLCISYLRKLGIPHELVMSEHYDYDKFTCNFDKEIKSNWGYTQIHHWREPTTFVTGACGDEFFLRGPATANIMLMHLGVNMMRALQPEHYHYHYFREPEKTDIYNAQLDQDTHIKAILHNKKDVQDYIMGMCINDHQHWHLGNTMTFTPFKDIRILATMLEMEKNDIVESILDARMQRELIRRNNPDLLQFLDQYKNQGRTGMLQMIEYYLT